MILNSKHAWLSVGTYHHDSEDDSGDAQDDRERPPLCGSRKPGRVGRAHRSPAGSKALRRSHRPTLSVRRARSAGGSSIAVIEIEDTDGSVNSTHSPYYGTVRGPTSGPQVSMFQSQFISNDLLVSPHIS